MGIRSEIWDYSSKLPSIYKTINYKIYANTFINSRSQRYNTPLQNRKIAKLIDISTSYTHISLPSVTTSIKSPVALSILAPDGRIVLLPKAPNNCEWWTPSKMGNITNTIRIKITDVETQVCYKKGIVPSVLGARERSTAAFTTFWSVWREANLASMESKVCLNSSRIWLWMSARDLTSCWSLPHSCFTALHVNLMLTTSFVNFSIASDVTDEDDNSWFPAFPPSNITVGFALAIVDGTYDGEEGPSGRELFLPLPWAWHLHEEQAWY